MTKDYRIHQNFEAQTCLEILKYQICSRRIEPSFRVSHCSVSNFQILNEDKQFSCGRNEIRRCQQSMTAARGSAYERLLWSQSSLPLKLLIIQFAWILPYLLFANYFERSLLPFRFLCYTEPDLLDVRTPIRQPLASCIKHLFPYHHPTKTCPQKQPVRPVIEPILPSIFTKVIVIRSAPKSSDYRNFIRKTWKAAFDKDKIPVIFVSGKGKDDQMLQIEGQEFNDILQFDFTDSYKNLTLKMMTTYAYFMKYPTMEDIIVINDDTIVNKSALMADIQVGQGVNSYMIGKVSRGYPRLIFPWLLWHVPGDMYPHKCYPPFVQGSSFIISRGAAAALVEHVCDFPFVHLDDIMTGILAHCLNLRLLHREGFDKHILEKFTVFHYQYSRHSAKELTQMWNRIKPKL